MDAIRKQAERFGAELVADDVLEVDLEATPKVVKISTTVSSRAGRSSSPRVRATASLACLARRGCRSRRFLVCHL